MFRDFQKAHPPLRLGVTRSDLHRALMMDMVNRENLTHLKDEKQATKTEQV